MQGAFQIPVSFDTGTNKIVVGDGNDFEPLSLPTYTGADASLVTAVSDPLTGGSVFSTPESTLQLPQGVTNIPAGGVSRPGILGVQVANRTWIANGPYRQQNNTGTSKSSHFAPQGATDIRLAYGNWNGTPNSPYGDTDNTNPNPVTYRAAIEYPAGRITPVFFNGSRNGIADNGATIVSDPVAIEIPAGAQFWVRTYTSVVTGDYWVQMGNSTSNTEGEGFAATDLTAAGSGPIARSDSFIMRPHAIYGRSDGSESVAIVGDSIAFGQGDTFGQDRASAFGGFIARAANAASLPWVGLAMPGETAARFLTSPTNHSRRGVLIGGCSVAISNCGVNDLQTGLSPSFSTLAASLVGVWQLLAMRGMVVWQTTITPFTTSTDSWATAENQTIATTRSSAVRVAINDWLRAGAPLDQTTKAPVAVGTIGAVLAGKIGHFLAGYLDVADAVETSRNSGIFKAGYTADGLHPAPVAHIAMSEVVAEAFA